MSGKRQSGAERALAIVPIRPTQKITMSGAELTDLLEGAETRGFWRGLYVNAMIDNAFLELANELNGIGKLFAAIDRGPVPGTQKAPCLRTVLNGKDESLLVLLSRYVQAVSDHRAELAYAMPGCEPEIDAAVKVATTVVEAFYEAIHLLTRADNPDDGSALRATILQYDAEGDIRNLTDLLATVTVPKPGRPKRPGELTEVWIAQAVEVEHDREGLKMSWPEKYTETQRRLRLHPAISRWVRASGAKKDYLYTAEAEAYHRYQDQGAAAGGEWLRNLWRNNKQHWEQLLAQLDDKQP